MSCSLATNLVTYIGQNIGGNPALAAILVLATNLVTYIGQNIGGDPAFAAILVSVFEGLCYTTPILGAVMADSKWGRYQTIKIFSIVYLVGILMLSLSSYPPLKMIPAADEDPNWITYCALCGSLLVIALGTGGIKPNVAAFGADQFDENDPQDRKEKESFFNWFYLAINVGSFIACTVIVYIQDQMSWTIGFAIPGFVMLAAIVLFTAGSKRYKHVRPTESPMTRVAKVVYAALHNSLSCSNTYKHVRPTEFPMACVAKVVYAALHNRYLKKQIPQQLQPTKHEPAQGGQYGSYTSAQIQDSEAGQPPRPAYNAKLQVPESASMSHKWLEDAITEWQTDQGETMRISGLAGYSPRQVEEMSSMFVQQGNLMDRTMPWFNGQTATMPAASMSIFNTVSIIVLIYLYDKFFEPAVKRCYNITLLRRIGWGMAVASIAMLTAAAVEWWRLQKYNELYPCPVDCLDADQEGGILGHANS
eukprot:gene12248-15388_t